MHVQQSSKPQAVEYQMVYVGEISCSTAYTEMMPSYEIALMHEQNTVMAGSDKPVVSGQQFVSSHQQEIRIIV